MYTPTMDWNEIRTLHLEQWLLLEVLEAEYAVLKKHGGTRAVHGFHDRTQGLSEENRTNTGIIPSLFRYYAIRKKRGLLRTCQRRYLLILLLVGKFYELPQFGITGNSYQSSRANYRATLLCWNSRCSVKLLWMLPC